MRLVPARLTASQVIQQTTHLRVVPVTTPLMVLLVMTHLMVVTAPILSCMAVRSVITAFLCQAAVCRSLICAVAVLMALIRSPISNSLISMAIRVVGQLCWLSLTLQRLRLVDHLGVQETRLQLFQWMRTSHQWRHSVRMKAWLGACLEELIRRDSVSIALVARWFSLVLLITNHRKIPAVITAIWWRYARRIPQVIRRIKR